MFNTKTFVPRYGQFKLHSEAQIGYGVADPGDQVPSIPGNADYAPRAELTSQISAIRYYTYGTLRYCS